MHFERSSERQRVEIAARLSVEESAPLAVLITDISRGGCKVEAAGALPAARSMVILIEGWPPLAGRTVWNSAGQTGCIFDPKLSADDYASLLARTVTMVSEL